MTSYHRIIVHVYLIFTLNYKFSTNVIFTVYFCQIHFSKLDNQLTVIKGLAGLNLCAACGWSRFQEVGGVSCILLCLSVSLFLWSICWMQYSASWPHSVIRRSMWVMVVFTSIPSWICFPPSWNWVKDDIMTYYHILTLYIYSQN